MVDRFAIVVMGGIAAEVGAWEPGSLGAWDLFICSSVHFTDLFLCFCFLFHSFLHPCVHWSCECKVLSMASRVATPFSKLSGGGGVDGQALCYDAAEGGRDDERVLESLLGEGGPRGGVDLKPHTSESV